jgi:hypothetical protein
MDRWQLSRHALYPDQHRPERIGRVERTPVVRGQLEQYQEIKPVE